LDPGFPVVPVGLWTLFVAALDKVQYDYHPHAAQLVREKMSRVRKAIGFPHRKRIM
jgi:hypothetical protein